VTLEKTVAGGNRLASLRALRDVLAKTLDTSTSARDTAALANRLTDVLEQIELAERASVPVKGTPLDELDAKRSSRGAAPRRGARTTG
jgi:hypothetical protein